MLPSDTIKEKMRGHEGLRLTAYRCPAGVLTIGYGHTGPDVRPGMRISRLEAVRLFDADVNAFAAGVARLLPEGVTQPQFDALVSLAYNIGLGAFSRSSLLRRVKADPADPAIREEFMKWVYAGGAKLPGLVRRRKAEADHYFSL